MVDFLQHIPRDTVFQNHFKNEARYIRCHAPSNLYLILPCPINAMHSISKATLPVKGSADGVAVTLIYVVDF